MVEWWKTHEPDIPNWAEVFKLILLACATQLSSSKKGLLIVAKCIQQYRSLEDYILVMLQYNSRKC